jgi:hypothetical protein
VRFPLSPTSSLDSLTPVAQTAIDYLTRLPLELLEHICKLTGLDWHTYTLAFVSKAFLPFSRNRRFKSVYIAKPSSLVKFCDIVQASPGVGPYVKDLFLAFRGAGYVEDAGKDDGSTSTKDFLKLLQRLPTLEKLSVKHSTRLIKAYLTDNKTRRLLPSLRHLTLEDPFTGWSNPFDPAHWSLLSRRHPELTYLDLDVERSHESLGRYKRRGEIEPFPSKWQWNLYLRGPLSQNAAVEDLIDSFDQHISFGLYETSTTTADKFPIVFIPVSRGFLRDLSLELPVPLSQLPPPNIDAFTRVLLPAFTALRTLHFGRNSFDAALIPALQALSTLEDLAFSYGSGAVAADLKALVANPQHLPRLRLLTPGQIVEATYGYGYGAELVDIPSWTGSFTRADGEALLAICEGREVKLSGCVGDFLRHERREKEREAREKKVTEAA